MAVGRGTVALALLAGAAGWLHGRHVGVDGSVGRRDREAYASAVKEAMREAREQEAKARAVQGEARAQVHAMERRLRDLREREVERCERAWRFGSVISDAMRKAERLAQEPGSPEWLAERQGQWRAEMTAKADAGATERERLTQWVEETHVWRTGEDGKTRTADGEDVAALLAHTSADRRMGSRGHHVVLGFDASADYDSGLSADDLTPVPTGLPEGADLGDLAAGVDPDPLATVTGAEYEALRHRAHTSWGTTVNLQPRDEAPTAPMRAPYAWSVTTTPPDPSLVDRDVPPEPEPVTEDDVAQAAADLAALPVEDDERARRVLREAYDGG